MMTELSKIRDDRNTRRKGAFGSMFDDFLNDRFLSSFESPFMNNRLTIPAANISEEDNCYEIALAVPGMKKEDFHVELSDDMLTIKVEHQQASDADTKKYTRREYSYGAFSRSFTVPTDVDRDNISAKYTDGVLSVTVCRDKTMDKSSSKNIAVE